MYIHPVGWQEQVGLLLLLWVVGATRELGDTHASSLAAVTIATATACAILLFVLLTKFYGC